MELLRFTRASNDGLSKVVTSICSFLAVLSAIFGFAVWSVDPIIAIVALFFGLVFGAVAVTKLSRLFFPVQYELVMESDRIRFGRVDQPNQQKTIFRADIKCLVVDFDAEASLCVDIGGVIAPLLAPGLIRDVSQMTAVANAVSKHWKEIPVHDRETYQALCRQ